MKKQKPMAKFRQIDPVDFEFDTNKGKSIGVKTENETIQGSLLGIFDNMIILKSLSKRNFPVLSHIDYSEIKSIILY